MGAFLGGIPQTFGGGGSGGGLLDFLGGGFGSSAGFDPSNPLSNLGSLLGGITGSSNPLFDVMALMSFINEGQLTSEQMGFIKNVLDQQSSAMNTAMNPNKLMAYQTALTPQTPGLSFSPASTSPGQLATNAGKITGGLSQPFITNTLNPVDARLAASGQATSPSTRQYVSEQALAPAQLQLSQMGMQGAEDIMGQQTSIDQMQLQAALAELQAHLQTLGMGQQSAEFGLSLPFAAQPKYPTFGVQNPIDTTSLSALLGGSGGGGFNFGSFGVP